MLAANAASAAANAQAQTARDVFALERFANLIYRFGSNRDHATCPLVYA